MTVDTPVLHRLVSPDRPWPGSSAGVTAVVDEAWTLCPVPAPDAAVEREPPFDPPPSGIAVDGRGLVLLSQGDAHRLLLRDRACDTLHGGPAFGPPAGLAIAGDELFVADPAHARVLVLRCPSLAPLSEIRAGLVQPTILALDMQARLCVLDAGTSRVRRFLPEGSADLVFDAMLATLIAAITPVGLAVAADGTLYLSDAVSQAVFVLAPGDSALQTLAQPTGAPAMQPRALATRAGLVFVHDAAGGAILVFDATGRTQRGELPRWRGPVAAMCFDSAGHLLVKPDGGADFVQCTAGTGVVAGGLLEAGPWDAGLLGDWQRVAVDADVPPDTRVRLLLHAGADDQSRPTQPDGWHDANALDALVPCTPVAATDVAGARRYLWLRIRLDSADGLASPRVLRVHAHTTAGSYLDKLPAIYRRDDAPARFLERLLALARSTFDDVLQRLDDVPRRFDATMAPADHLQWLARCLGFVPPRGRDAAALRALVVRLPELYARRGTLSGLCDMAEVFAGVRPHVVEAFRARHVWQLGTTARLGFDTALAAATPDGLVVPGQVQTDAAYAGLQGDYFAGVEFDRHLMQRIDRDIDLLSGDLMPMEEVSPGVLGPVHAFSVRWSGQMQPRHDETYTFHVAPDRGWRVWIGAMPVIDTWRDGAAAQTSAKLREPLEAGRWYPVVIEFRHPAAMAATTLPVQLAWSSRSQPLETVPMQRLYAVLDERADLARAAAVVEVGHAVVGESRPAAASEFGAALFADHAHLFTVVAPAGSCRDAERRAALRAVIEAEKPAHSDFHLCFAEARMRVGFQARLSVDAIVAKGPPPLRLDGTVLGRDSFLGGEPPGRRLGIDSRIGPTNPGSAR